MVTGASSPAWLNTVFVTNVDSFLAFNQAMTHILLGRVAIKKYHLIIRPPNLRRALLPCANALICRLLHAWSCWVQSGSRLAIG